MSKKTVVTLFTILIILIIFGVTFFLVDFNLVVRGNDPKFCINTNVYNTATTKEYVGLGYKIIRYNIGTEKEENNFGTWFLMYDSTKNIKEESKDVRKTVIDYDIIGTIEEYDKQELILKVKSNESSSKYEEANIVLNSDTIITKNGKSYYKQDLKVGDKISVIFSEVDVKNVAISASAKSIKVLN